MWWPDVETAEFSVAASLGARVALRTATTPATVGDLSSGEREQVEGRDGLRRRDWLLGRAALKDLVQGADTSGLRFPHRCFSLTHSVGVAVAARADGDQAGLGVDYEGTQSIDPRTARFFIHENERDAGVVDLLRLWTVKEALFKATPDNEGAVLLDYEVAEVAAWAGGATDRQGRAFRYVSGSWADGWLTVAVCDAAA